MVFVFLVEQCCSKRRSWLWKPPALTFGLLALHCHQLESRDSSFVCILFLLQEESASPLLRRRKASMVKADKKEVNADSLDLEKEEEGNISVGTSTGDLPISFHAEELKS